MDTSDINFSDLYFLVHITMSFTTETNKQTTQKKTSGASNKIYLFLLCNFYFYGDLA